MSDLPRRVRADDPNLEDILALIRVSFAYMEARIDPPSSMTRLTVEGIAAQAETGEVWVIGAPPLACVFLEARSDCLYLGKLAVAEAARGRGFSRRLVALAARRALALGLPALELQSRVELTENHEIFARLGFVKVAETAHPGFTRPTSITMRRELAG